MEGLHRRRKDRQPLNMPSCGSVFRNPEGASAAKLIEEAGLKGRTVGGAQISDVHANFIVNTGSATCADVLQLISDARNVVHERTGIWLVPEVRVLAFAKGGAGCDGSVWAMTLLNTVGASYWADLNEAEGRASASASGGIHNAEGR